MSEAEKRSVHTDALATLGNLIGPDEKRDAIHIAVEPVVAAQFLRAGDHVTVKDGWAYLSEPHKGVGIVDPFLNSWARTGDRFWLLIYPRQIKSLRHVWSHPAFPDEVGTPGPAVISPALPATTPQHEAELWLRNYCKEQGWEWETLMESLAHHAGTGDWGKEYFTICGEDASGSIPAEFWVYAELATGRKYPHAEYFACSC